MTTDRSTEPQAEACPTHQVTAVLIVTATVPEGVTGQHLAEYLAAFAANRENDLHEDIHDELEAAPMEAQGKGLLSGSLLATAARLVQEVSARPVCLQQGRAGA